MQILISGNCQRYPLASALARHYPRAQIVALEEPRGIARDAQARSLLGALTVARVWVTQGSRADVAHWTELAGGHRPQVIRVPAIGFAAFHPDICLVANGDGGDGGNLIAPAFHSAIAAWAYRHSLPTKTACGLFAEQTYCALGYFGAWDASVAFLKRAFMDSDLAQDFDAFFLRLKRGGVFMHTFNHPRQEAMELLGELLAALMEAGEQAPEAAARIAARQDQHVLAQTDWPVYPPIANRLGLAGGSYVWRVGGQTIDGAENFVSALYASYRAQGITPTNLRILNRSLSELDRVLMPCLKAYS